MKELGSFSCKQWGFNDGFLVLNEVNIEGCDNCKIKIGRAKLKDKNLFLEDVNFYIQDKIDLAQFLKTSDYNFFITNAVLWLGNEKIPWQLSKKNEKAELTLFFENRPLEIVMEKSEIRAAFSEIKASLLCKCLSFYHDWQVSQGTISAQNLTFNTKDKSLNGHITCHNLAATNEYLSLNSSLEEGIIEVTQNDIYFNFKDLHANAVDNPLVDFRIEKGAVGIENGQMLPCQLEAFLMGLKGQIIFNPTTIEMNFAGTGLASFFPDDPISLVAKIQRHVAGSDLNGKLKLGSNTFDFGAHLGAGKNQSKVGWFRGKNVLLEKFLSPFLLTNTKLDLSGVVDFEGTIDPEGVTFYYVGKDIVLENQQFCLKCPENGREINGFHYFDFKDKKTFGNFALKNGSYFQKNYGFTLENASSQVFFQDRQIILRSISTSYKDLDLSGELVIDFPKAKPVELWIKSKHFNGSIESAKSLLNHFIPSFFWNIPLDGEIASENQGLFFHFILDQKTNLTDAQICGQLRGGYLGQFFSLKDYTVSFDYDKKNNQIAFDEGVGVFFLKGQNYKLSTKKLQFQPTPEKQLDLDLLISKENQAFNILGKMQGNLICLAGNLIDLQGQINESSLDIKTFNCKGFTGKGHFDFLNHNSSFEVTSKEIGDLKFEGSFVNHCLDGDLTFGDICLSSVLKNYEKLWNPQGKITGKAKVHWNLGQSDFELKATSNFEDLAVAGIDFGKGANLQCTLSTEQGLIVEGLEMATNEDSGRYKLGKLHYNQEGQKIKFDELDFCLPKEKIGDVTAFLRKIMPQKVTSEMIQWLEGLKKEGDLEGKVSLEVFPNKIWVQLALKDGKYYFQDVEHEVADFLLTMTPNHIEVNTNYLYKGFPFYLCFDSDPSFTKGKLALYEKRSCSDCIVANWKKTKIFHIDDIKGKFLGITVNLKENADSVLENRLAFRGKVDLDLRYCSHLFPEKISDFIEKTAMAQGYSLEGDFIFSPKDLAGFIFSGQLNGTNFGLGSLCLQKLKAEVLYAPRFLEVKNLNIEDGDGNLHCPLVELKQMNQKWHCKVPEVSLSSLRLSKLKAQKEKKSLFKPTTIQSFELHDFKGILGDKKSFGGYGEVSFSHVSRKSFFSTLLFLPSEITARLGLDLNLLVPAKGKIRYKIDDGKVNLTQFKSMYSEGKRSRFYLAEGQPAYVDFDGNLNMKIKMKQYNLLMKVAEFFVISVKGNIKQPSISFHNLFEANFDDEDE